MSIIDYIEELLQDTEGIGPKDLAIGIWDVVESFGQRAVACKECGVWFWDENASCEHNNFSRFVVLEIPEIERKERETEVAHLSELMALFPSSRKKNEQGRNVW